MEKLTLKSKKIAVLGFGKNNWHLVFWLLKNGCGITICDKNPTIRREIIFKANEKEEDLLEKIREWRPGENYLKNLTDFDVVFRSPGLPYLTPEIQEAKSRGVVVSNQTELFLKISPAKVIGVTGTKGKSTTTAMIAHLLSGLIKNASVYLAGNIGLDPFVFIEELKKDDVVVLELSSFQLQGISASPHVGVITRLGADHLDHHRDIEEYYQAKKNILINQKSEDFTVVNIDEPISLEIKKEAKSKIWEYSGQKPVAKGAYVGLNEKEDILETIIADDKKIFIAARENEGKVLGRHNLENWAAAATVGYFVFGIEPGKIREKFKNFQGLPHRLEFLREVNGVKFYNDSYSTNSASTIEAIKSFSGKSPIILICGGSSKNADFTELAETTVNEKVKAMVLIGEEADKIISNVKFLISKKIPITKCPKIINQNPRYMAEIVNLARQEAERGDAVLFSPACASFDMFKNATDRGEQFRSTVENLK